MSNPEAQREIPKEKLVFATKHYLKSLSLEEEKQATSKHCKD